MNLCVAMEIIFLFENENTFQLREKARWQKEEVERSLFEVGKVVGVKAFNNFYHAVILNHSAL
jgi:hypothetical protein